MGLSIVKQMHGKFSENRKVGTLNKSKYKNKEFLKGLLRMKTMQIDEHVFDYSQVLRKGSRRISNELNQIVSMKRCKSRTNSVIL